MVIQMVKIQIDLADNEDRLVEIFKAENRLETKEIALKEMIKRSGKCNHKYDLVDKKTIGLSANSETIIIQRCIYCGQIKKDSIKG